MNKLKLAYKKGVSRYKNEKQVQEETIINSIGDDDILDVHYCCFGNP